MGRRQERGEGGLLRQWDKKKAGYRAILKSSNPDGA